MEVYYVSYYVEKERSHAHGNEYIESNIDPKLETIEDFIRDLKVSIIEQKHPYLRIMDMHILSWVRVEK